MRSVPIALILWLTVAPGLSDELNCLTEEERSSSSLYAHLQRQAYAALDRRDQLFETLLTPARIRERQAELKAFFLQQLGGLPEASPLNARTVRTIEADGYRIECVIFDSQPNHRITANLYLPVADRPVPGVVVSSGHSRTAKTADYNQRFGIMMARQGMAALCFDPIGQGERSQILTAEGIPRFNGTTTEHFLTGVGSILVGRNTARYRVWDAMRAIDYLVSRPEVDDKRVGFTGCSGGGTVTSYVMALDSRVACAAPACYLTTFRQLINTIGPQDAEQNIYGQLRFGMDHPDYVLMRAPQPTLISSTSGDFFSIAGSWDNFRQAKRIYGRLGLPERVDLVETDGKHGVYPQNLATIAYWMNRWLKGKDDVVSAVELKTRPSAELLCTESGQVAELPGELTVFDLNAKYQKSLAVDRAKWQESRTADDLRAQILALLNLGDWENEAPEFEDIGRVERDGYHIDKLVLRTKTEVPIPGLTFHPPVPDDDAYLYLHDSGKLGDTQQDGPIEELMNNGYAVVTVDLCGQGETAAGDRDPLLTDWKTFYLSYLLGQPLLGLRVKDALAAGDFVAYYQKNRDAPRKVHLVGVGQSGLIALHAAALQPELFSSVTVKNAPESWADIVSQSVPSGQLDSTVHAALTVYDIPDLVRLIGKDKVRFVDED